MQESGKIANQVSSTALKELHRDWVTNLGCVTHDG